VELWAERHRFTTDPQRALKKLKVALKVSLKTDRKDGSRMAGETGSWNRKSNSKGRKDRLIEPEPERRQ
jgi:hypothetical protein